MPRSESADVRTQVRAGLKIGLVAIALIALLAYCARIPLRRLTLDRPTYSAGPVVPLPHTVGAMAAGDIDGDGHDDLLVCGDAAARPVLTVYLGGPDGLDFEAPRQLESPFVPFDVSLGDLDGDGRAELVATSHSDSANAIPVWWNEGNLTFRRTRAEVPLRFLETFDYDGDGTRDLVGITRDNEDVSVHLVTGGEVSVRDARGDWLHDSSIRDAAFNRLGGGGLDFAAISHDPGTGGRVRVLHVGGILEDVEPVTAIPAERVSSLVPSVVFTDLNGDDRPDVAFVDGGRVRLLLHLGRSEFQEADPISGVQGAVRVTGGDFDADGRVDLVTIGADNSSLQVSSTR